VLFLHEDASVRGLGATGFIHECQRGIVGGQRLEKNLPRLAAPHLHDIVQHVLVLFVPSPQGDVQPLHADAFPLASHPQYDSGGIIRRDRQAGHPRIDDRQAVPLPPDFDESGIDPTPVLPIHVDPVPVLVVCAPDQFDVGPSTQAVQEQVFCSGAIATTEPICRHGGMEAFDRGERERRAARRRREGHGGLQRGTRVHRSRRCGQSRAGRAFRPRQGRWWGRGTRPEAAWREAGREQQEQPEAHWRCASEHTLIIRGGVLTVLCSLC